MSIFDELNKLNRLEEIARQPLKPPAKKKPKLVKKEKAEPLPTKRLPNMLDRDYASPQLVEMVGRFRREHPDATEDQINRYKYNVVQKLVGKYDITNSSKPIAQPLSSLSIRDVSDAMMKVIGFPMKFQIDALGTGVGAIMGYDDMKPGWFLKGKKWEGYRQGIDIGATTALGMATAGASVPTVPGLINAGMISSDVIQGAVAMDEVAKGGGALLKQAGKRVNPLAEGATFPERITAVLLDAGIVATGGKLIKGLGKVRTPIVNRLVRLGATKEEAGAIYRAALKGDTERISSLTDEMIARQVKPAEPKPKPIAAAHNPEPQPKAEVAKEVLNGEVQAQKEAVAVIESEITKPLFQKEAKSKIASDVIRKPEPTVKESLQVEHIGEPNGKVSNNGGLSNTGNPSKLEIAKAKNSARIAELEALTKTPGLKSKKSGAMVVLTPDDIELLARKVYGVVLDTGIAVTDAIGSIGIKLTREEHEAVIGKLREIDEDGVAKIHVPPRVDPTEGTTGIRNETLDRLFGEIEKTTGRAKETLIEEGERAVDAGADYMGIVQKIGNGEISIAEAPDAFGVVRAGMRRIQNEIATAVSTGRSQAEIDSLRESLDDYLRLVQKGKGYWSEIGRSMQAEVGLDTGNIESVLSQARQVKADHNHGQLTDRETKQYEALVEKVRKADEDIGRLQKENDELRDRLDNGTPIGEEIAEAASPKRSRVDHVQRGRQRRREGIKALNDVDVESLLSSFNMLGVASGNADVEFAKLSRAIKDIVLGAIEEYGYTLKEALAHVVSNKSEYKLPDKMTEQNIIDAMTWTSKKPKQTLDDVQKAKMEAMAQAKRLSSEYLDKKNKAAKVARDKKIEELNATIADLDEQLKTGNLRRRTKEEKTLDAKIEQLRSIRDMYDSEIRRKLKEQEYGTGTRIAMGIKNFGQALQLGYDAGALLRQGRVLGYQNPRKAAIAMAEAFRSMKSDKAMALAYSRIRDKEIGGVRMATVRRKAGLSLGDYVNAPEETAIPTWLKTLGNHVKLPLSSLERFQTTYLNRLRAEVFDAGYLAGYSDEELKTLARHINSIGGRSNLKSINSTFAYVFTSPRWEASRWETIVSPLTLAKQLRSNGRWNRAAVKQLGLAFADIGILYGLGRLVAETAGGTFNTDYKSADFMKIRVGDNVFDISSGLAPRVRDAIRLLAGIAEEDKATAFVDASGKAVYRAMSPVIGSSADLARHNMLMQQGVDYEDTTSFMTGYKMDDTQKSWYSPVTPLIAKSAIQANKKGGYLDAMTVAGLDFVGISSNNYTLKEKKPKLGGVASIMDRPRKQTAGGVESILNRKRM